MMDSFLLQKQYRVQAGISSDHHIHVFVSRRDIEVYGEQLAVGQAAWLSLWENEKDVYGFDTGKPSNTARMLRKLCESEGTEKVKRKFIQTIVFKPEEEEDNAM